MQASELLIVMLVLNTLSCILHLLESWLTELTKSLYVWLQNKAALMYFKVVFDKQIILLPTKIHINN